MKIKETDLAAKVVEWLNAQHWDVYQEVKVGGSIADIVGIQNNLVWVIECKTSLSLSLICQAIEWKRYSHFVSVAAPVHRNVFSKSRQGAEKILKQYGIGIINVRMDREEINIPQTKPALNRKAMSDIVKKSLNDNQKTAAPAGSQGGYWTPFQETSRGIKRMVDKYPGICLKDLIEKISHHYASDKTAKACVRHWIEKGIIRDIMIKKEGKYLKLYSNNKTISGKAVF